MKRILIFWLAITASVSTMTAEVGDALKGMWPVTDSAMKRSLNGQWALKVVSGISEDRTVPQRDDSWGQIPVPGCWEAYGFCEPRYSFPDSLTGYFRQEFQVPAEWRGQRIGIRLDGVLRGYDLWVNGHLVGSWEQAYNTCQFDLTPYLTKGAFRGEPQQLAMRVYSRFKGHEFDNFDDWAPMGIFRDVTLFAVPTVHLSDLTVTTHTDGRVDVVTQVANATRTTTTDYEIRDAQGRVVSTGGPITQPQLWTAETPYLYTLNVYVREKGRTLQTFTQKIGLREVSIDGNILKVNGQPVKLRGVTSHSTDPQTVKVISDDLTLKDMRLMKEASINYIRTSHYPREPRFFELCDSLGFYVVCEAPFGSRGEKHLSKPDYYDILQTRVKATIDRHKNYPSVIVWSLGNENPLPKSCQRIGEYAAQLDPSRPYCFPEKGSTFRNIGFEKFPKQVPLYAPHYPTTSQLRDFYTKTDRPLIFTEYCHTLGISFEDHDRQWDIIERTPAIAGGSVWEWVDQGMPFKSEKGKVKSEKYGYEERVFLTDGTGFEMNGNQGTDGLLYADRTPLPNYYELQHNYARAFVTIDHSPLTIDHSPLTIDHSPLTIEHSAAQKETADKNGQSSMVNGQCSMFNGQCSIFNLQCTNRYDFLNLKDNVTFHWFITTDRDTVARGAFSPDCAPRSSVPYTLSVPYAAILSQPSQALTILHFDIEDAQGHTFLHQSFVLNKPEQHWSGEGDPMQLVQEGPLVRAGRKPTMAECITQKGKLPAHYLLPIDNAEVKADVVTEPTADGGQRVSFTLTPDTADVFRAELGLACLLDPALDRVQWIGQGPFASYPGRHRACRYGFWAKHQDDLYFEGNHGGVDAAYVSDSQGRGLLIVGDSLNLNFEQTDRGLVLTVNAAVSGQGPKFAKTAFKGWRRGDGPVSASFTVYRVESAPRLFQSAADVPAPFRPFLTQYDTYLMRYADIKKM